MSAVVARRGSAAARGGGCACGGTTAQSYELRGVDQPVKAISIILSRYNIAFEER